jgi:hypothetical protein
VALYQLSYDPIPIRNFGKWFFGGGCQPKSRKKSAWGEGELEGAGLSTGRGDEFSAATDGIEGAEDGIVELGVPGWADELEGEEPALRGDGELEEDFFVGQEALGGALPIAQEEPLVEAEVLV